MRNYAFLMERTEQPKAAAELRERTAVISGLRGGD